MKTYRLKSTSLVHTPGIIAWAVNGAKFKKDRARIIELVSTSYSIPRPIVTKLLDEEIKYVVDNETVIFTV